MSSKKPCSCIRDSFLLHVNSPAKESVLIHDLSNWVDEDGFAVPDFYLLKVKFPNSQEKEIEVSPSTGVVVDKSEYGDGIYEFTLDNCGVVYTQKELITSKVECSLDIALVKAKNKKDYESIYDIRDDISVAKATAALGNYETANKIIELVKQKLQNLDCNCECK